MKVCEMFEAEKIDRDFLWDRFDDEAYWASAKNFIDKEWEREIESMTPKQAAWVSRILEDAVEKRIEG